MSAWLRSIGISSLPFSHLSLHSIVYLELSWPYQVFGVVYLMLCRHIQQQLPLAAIARYERVSNYAALRGRSPLTTSKQCRQDWPT